MAADPYVYPGTGVLRNLLDLRDADELARTEAVLTSARLMELAERPLPGKYDTAHLQAMHRHIFGDVYAWAGEFRTVEISKGESVFALPQHIESYLSNVLKSRPQENYLRGLDRDAFLDRLASYYADINSAHPFRDGNGRAQRAFIGQLAEHADYHIAWERLDPARNVEASRAAHGGDQRPMRQMLGDLTVSRTRDRDRTSREDDDDRYR